MASPHATGVAALILSQLGDRHRRVSDQGSIAQMRTILLGTATPIDCPSPEVLALYAPFPSLNSDAPQTCQGSKFHNSWYGFGEVNALKAVQRAGE